MTEEEKKIWNAAIEAAAQAVTKAPVFPKENHGGPAMDAERLRVLEAARRTVSALAR